MTVAIWNSADQTTGIALSSGDTVATATTSDDSPQGVRSNVSHNSASGGKFVIGFRDVLFNSSGPNPFDWVGIILANTGDTTLTRANGFFNQVILTEDGNSYNGTSTVADSGSSFSFSDFSAITTSCDIDLALDFDNKLYWYRISNQNSNAWQNGGNPAAATGGRTIHTDGVFFPSTRLTNTPHTCTIEPLPAGMPAGFSTWGTAQTGFFGFETPDAFMANGYQGIPGAHGDLMSTETADIFAAAGFQPVSGTLRSTETSDIFSAFGRQPLTGALHSTERTDIFAATGLGRGEDGTFIVTEATDHFAAAGNTPIAGTFAVTENPDQFSAIGAGVTVTKKRRIFFVS